MTAETSGRTFDQVPSAPTSRSTVVLPPSGEGQLVPAVAERAGRGDLVAPGDAAGVEGCDEQVAQSGPVDLGAAAVAALGLVVDEDRAGLVQDAHGLALRMGEREEPLVEAGLAQRELPGLLVHVEGAALAAGVGGGVAFVDRGVDAVHLQDASEDEAAEAAPTIAMEGVDMVVLLIRSRCEGGGEDSVDQDVESPVGAAWPSPDTSSSPSRAMWG